MKITPEILKRYIQDKCTSHEQKEIEAWLKSGEDEEWFLGPIELKNMSTEVWNGLSQQIQTNRSMQLKRTIHRYAAGVSIAACFAIVSFMAGFNIGTFPFTTNLTTEASTDTALDDLLYLSGSPRKFKKISAEICELSFNGVLRVYNNSHRPKHLICEGQTVTLPPGKVSYFLNTKIKGFRKISFQSGEMLFYDNNIQKSPISICV
ncbi:hypothetical protein [Echinicola sp. 20G]|uniref:hypothetical protein n=1 Tax=Echinicola sp. 20G TaxID=2781961 RepID=UPI0019108D29|nr:hypothetical protein [Echinicola sp. 20G]